MKLKKNFEAKCTGINLCKYFANDLFLTFLALCLMTYLIQPSERLLHGVCIVLALVSSPHSSPWRPSAYSLLTGLQSPFNIQSDDSPWKSYVDVRPRSSYILLLTIIIILYWHYLFIFLFHQWSMMF